jgi:hypothetical protein
VGLKKTSQLFLNVDDGMAPDVGDHMLPSWGEPRDDALRVAIASNRLPMITFILFELMQPLWVHRSLALVFNAHHLEDLLRRYPGMVAPFLQPRHMPSLLERAAPHSRPGNSRTAITELCVEPSPEPVSRECDLHRIDRAVVRGSPGLEPHKFWSEKGADTTTSLWRQFKDAIAGSSESLESLTEVEVHRIGISGLLDRAKAVLVVVDRLPTTLKQEIFSLTCIHSVMKYEITQNNARWEFMIELMYHVVFLLCFSAWALLITSNDDDDITDASYNT